MSALTTLRRNTERQVQYLECRLTFPEINALFDNRKEQDEWLPKQADLQRQNRRHIRARDTFFSDADEAPVHLDREPTAIARLELYRWGHIDEGAQWDAVMAGKVSKANWRWYRGKVAAVQTRAMGFCIDELRLFFLRLIPRTGGLTLWRQSRYIDRERVFAHQYDQCPVVYDIRMHQEESSSVSFTNIHGARPDDADDVRHKFKAANRLKFMIMAEAVFQHLIKPDTPNRWAVNRIWRSIGKNPQIIALGLPDGLDEIPARAFGTEGIYGRQAPRQTIYWPKITQ